MLIGTHRTVAELEKIMEEKITANKMEMREVEKEYYDLQNDMRNNPPRKGTEDNRPAQSLALQKRITELQENNTWLESKIQEAEMAEDRTQKVYLTLNDCLQLGIVLADEQGE